MLSRDVRIEGSWRKSSRSHIGGSDQGQCVELASIADQSLLAVRDSKRGEASPVFMMAPAAFSKFLTDVKAGKHDMIV